MYYLYFIYAKMDINMKWKEIKIGMFRIRSWSRLTHNCRDVGSLASFKVKEGTETSELAWFCNKWKHFDVFLPMASLFTSATVPLGRVFRHIFGKKNIAGICWGANKAIASRYVTLQSGIAQILDVNKPKTSLKKYMHTVSNFISFNLSNVGEYSGDKVEMRKDHIQV